MSKPKARPPPTSVAGVFKPEVVQDVAESVGITSLPDVVASALSSDVEYRVHQVVDEAARFMRHARRTTLTTSDIEQALRILNIEPLYGHSPHAPLAFRKAPGISSSSTAPVFFVEDEEVEFDRVLREDKISLPRPTRWTAHWLAVEGVQPLIPENPPAIPREGDSAADTSKNALTQAAGAAGARLPGGIPPSGSGLGVSAPAGTQTAGQGKTQQLQQQQLVKQVLSRELQLYYTRLTSSLLPATTDVAVDTTKRTAALASLRHDAGLQALLPYLVRWVGEGVVAILKADEEALSDASGATLEMYMDVIAALLENTTLFVEPYLHQLLPPIFSTLLYSSLPVQRSRTLRTQSSQMLAGVLKQHSATYPSLAPRIMKTLLLALISPGRSQGTREGAVRGLVAIGKEAIRKGLIECGGAKVIGTECVRGDTSPVVHAVVDAFNVLCPPSDMVVPLQMDKTADVPIINELREKLGDFFAEQLLGDREQARTILAGDQEIGP